MSTADANLTRQALESERARLTEQMSHLEVNDEDGDFDENFADTAQVTAEQGEARALFSALRNELADVENALTRLDAGTYGTCESCGQEIGAARLEALPMARLCITCAS